MSTPKPLPSLLSEWAEEVVGPVQAVRDVSHDRPNSRVWQLTCGTDRVFLKVAPTPTFYVRETRAYREAAPALETGRVPRLLETHAQQQSLLMTQVPGRNVQTLALTPAQQRAVHRQAGRWLRRFHGSPGDLTPTDHADAVSEVARAVRGAEAHLESAGDLIGKEEQEIVRQHATELAGLGPLSGGYAHGDFQERNWLLDTEAGTLAVVDLERARPHAAVVDFVRLACGPWVGRSDLREAFCDGYGRTLTSIEETALRCLTALDAASAISWGVPHHDREIVQRGYATLARLGKAGAA
ncbi:aminoglycoside phosphotransferase family protein [Streptomyces sp. NPDC058256]|uniref:aminoglycoside phosphotransferase family protein n=1 Tax=Streptomyces sp. NPDC058256 TaxID=3346408 RepID=UPI0036E72D04